MRLALLFWCLLWVASISVDARDASTKEALPHFEDWRDQLRTEESTGSGNKRHAKQYIVGKEEEARVQAGFASGSQDGMPTEVELPAAKVPIIEPILSNKISKEKFNYASFDCGAIILATNTGARHATSILIENRDHYMLNECRTAQKYLVVELCDDTLIESITLANLEFFSSIFHRFHVSISDRYPPKAATGWQLLGEFRAKNVKDLQTFPIENPLMWARYLRIDFLTHYGHEFYCPISLLRVNGKRMMEDLKEAEEDLKSSEEVTPPLPVVENTTTTTTTSDWEHILLDMTRELGKMTEESSPVQHELPTEPSPTLQLEVEERIVAANESHLALNETHSDGKNETLSLPLTHPSPPPPLLNQSPLQSQGAILKLITKRLSALEFNSTLSLKYLELQTRRLNEVFQSLDINQQKRLQESTRRAESWSRDRWSALVPFLSLCQKRQHDTILKGLVQELDGFETQMQQAMQTLESKLKVINDEVIFYNRLYLVLVLITLVVVFLFTQAARIKTTLPLLFERQRAPAVIKRHSVSLTSPQQSQEDLSSLEKMTVEDGPEDDADVLTLGHPVTPKLCLLFSLFFYQVNRNAQAHYSRHETSAPTSPKSHQTFTKQPLAISSSSPDVFRSPALLPSQPRPKSTGDVLPSSLHDTWTAAQPVSANPHLAPTERGLSPVIESIQVATDEHGSLHRIEDGMSASAKRRKNKKKRKSHLPDPPEALEGAPVVPRAISAPPTRVNWHLKDQ